MANEKHEQTQKKSAGTHPVQRFVVCFLFLLCIFQKSINVFFERLFVRFRIVVSNLFAFNHRHTTARYVLPIVLFINFSPIFAEAIESPSIIKKSFAIERNKRPEFSNRYLQLWEYTSKVFVNILRPICGNWIETFKYGMNFIMEFYRSFGMPISPAITVDNISSESSDQKSDYKLIHISDNKINHKEEEEDDDFWFWLIIFIALYPVLFPYTQRQAL